MTLGEDRCVNNRKANGVMFELIRKLFDAEYAENRGQKEARVLDAIEQVVEGTDPRLRMVRGYERKLYRSVETALDYADELIDQFSEALDLEKSAYGSDPYLRAYFASMDQIGELLQHSRSFREFINYRDNKYLDECYALLAMHKEERTTLGMEMSGNIIRRDVSQTVVNYSGHRLITPGGDMAKTKQKLKERAFNHFITSSLERLVALRSHKEELEVQRNLLRSKLSALRKCGTFGLEDELQTACITDAVTKQDFRKLQEIEKELKRLVANPMTLEDYLTEIDAVMGHPEQHLGSERSTVRVNRMGIKIDDPADKQAETLSLREVQLGEDNIRYVVSLVRIPSETMRTAIPDFSF